MSSILDRIRDPKNYIRLRCPDCKVTVSGIPRERWDPPRAATAEIPCPQCTDKYHQPMTYYYDDKDQPLTDQECMAAADMAALHVNREMGEA